MKNKFDTLNMSIWAIKKFLRAVEVTGVDHKPWSSKKWELLRSQDLGLKRVVWAKIWIVPKSLRPFWCRRRAIMIRRAFDCSDPVDMVWWLQQVHWTYQKIFTRSRSRGSRSRMEIITEHEFLKLLRIHEITPKSCNMSSLEDSRASNML